MHLKAIREARGFSKRQTAKRLGTTIQAITRWERGQVKPNQASLEKLADLFSVTVDQLLGRTPFQTAS